MLSAPEIIGIIIFCSTFLVILLVCYSRDATRLTLAAKKLGMHNGEYALIAIDLELSSKWDKEQWTIGYRPIANVLNGVISIKVFKVNMKSNEFAYFNSEVVRRMALPPFNINQTASVSIIAVDIYTST